MIEIINSQYFSTKILGGIWEAMGSIPVGGSEFFFCPMLVSLLKNTSLSFITELKIYHLYFLLHNWNSAETIALSAKFALDFYEVIITRKKSPAHNVTELVQPFVCASGNNYKFPFFSRSWLCPASLGLAPLQSFSLAS